MRNREARSDRSAEKPGVTRCPQGNGILGASWAYSAFGLLGHRYILLKKSRHREGVIVCDLRDTGALGWANYTVSKGQPVRAHLSPGTVALLRNLPQQHRDNERLFGVVNRRPTAYAIGNLIRLGTSLSSHFPVEAEQVTRLLTSSAPENPPGYIPAAPYPRMRRPSRR